MIDKLQSMQEEVTQKTIALVIKTAKLDANVLKAAMRMYLNHRRQKAQKTHGKTSVKKLVGEGVGVSSIEVTDGNIKSFERVARKYNVDFAVKKDKTVCRCTCRKSVPEGKVGSNESKGCRSRKAGQTDGQRKRGDYKSGGDDKYE